MDVADSPIVELRLSEIYDVETSTINDDYLLVLQDYVALQLNATFGLCDWLKLRLLGSRFIPLHCRENGDIVSLRKPAMERLIRQTLQSRLDVRSPVSVPILIQFKTPGLMLSRRLNEPSRILRKISNNDVALAATYGDRPLCHALDNFDKVSVLRLPDRLPRRECISISDDNACNSNTAPDVVSNIINELCHHGVDTSRVSVGTSITADDVMESLAYSTLSDANVIYPTPVTPISTWHDGRGLDVVPRNFHVEHFEYFGYHVKQSCHIDVLSL